CGRAAGGPPSGPRLLSAAMAPRSLLIPSRCPGLVVGHLAQAPLEETSLAFVARERDRAAVVRGRVREAPGPTEQIRPRRGQQAIVDQLAAGLEGVEERQGLSGPVDHRDRDR